MVATRWTLLAAIARLVVAEIDVYNDDGSSFSEATVNMGNYSIQTESVFERALLKERQTCLTGWGTCRRRPAHLSMHCPKADFSSRRNSMRLPNQRNLELLQRYLQTS